MSKIITLHVIDMTIHEKDVTLVHFDGDMVQVYQTMHISDMTTHESNATLLL
jgi:hypothetical protein